MVSLPKAGGEAPKRRGRPPKKVLEAQQEPAGAAASLGAAILKEHHGLIHQIETIQNFS